MLVFIKFYSLFTAVDVKQLRVTVSGFLDLLQVAYKGLALDEKFKK